MQPNTTQITLVDDHRLFRSGLASLINSLPGYNILFEASNGVDLGRKLTPKNKPDVILLDINMPLMDGIETAKWLRVNYPDIKVIVLSMFEDAEKVLAMLRLGIKGYLLKDAEPHDFEQALQKVSGNEVYFPQFVTRHLVSNYNNEPDKVKLNSREIEFLKLASTEMTYKEIADRMCISARTVDGYRDQLFEKLNIKSRVGLVLYAVKNKLIEL
ncbi:response regulator transcription factor [Mucilaginibacter sp. Bleaf8]|uniref:response regulator transcription factor n=1 Tax=Mucilaginibacter sp. Bleaf8 TaxID=2834430 RepID=UPI001BCB9DF2|nr:response regulator transcription factor [Mucilaginibacter sp. Bleaf8]MBS7563763.1 response regulator transcription factor [Mucilaginibacter sp. Bleaf8]